MAHARKQIRGALVTALTGLATTGTRVYVNNVYSRPVMPFMNIDQGDEVIDNSTMGARLQQRVADYSIQVVAEGDTSLDALDTSSVEIEDAISADTTLGGKVRDAQYLGVQPAQNGDREKKVTQYTHLIRVEYLTREGDPETTL